MSERYDAFRSERSCEKRARELRDGYKKMLDETNQQAPLYHFNQSIRSLNEIISRIDSNTYLWKDASASEFRASVEKLKTGLEEHRQTYINSYQEGVDSAERARKAFAQKMMDLVNSFNKLDWAACAFGEIMDDTEAGIAKVKQKIHNFIRKLAKL